MLNIRRSMVVPGAVIVALFFSAAALAQGYYGSQLMSPGERTEHQSIMRSLPPGEREAYRARHHQAMQERAESLGFTLPEQPPVYRPFGRRWQGYGPIGRGCRAPGQCFAAPWYGYGADGPWAGRDGYGPGTGPWDYLDW